MKKGLSIFISVSLALLISSCDQNRSPEKNLNTNDSISNSSHTTQSYADTAKMVTTASGLTFIILKQGRGPYAKEGQEVLIHETMSYLNDSLLFSSRNLPSPVKVLIGGHQAIEGVDEGLRGMQKGELRKLIVPPALS